MLEKKEDSHLTFRSIVNVFFLQRHQSIIVSWLDKYKSEGTNHHFLSDNVKGFFFKCPPLPPPPSHARLNNFAFYLCLREHGPDSTNHHGQLKTKVNWCLFFYFKFVYVYKYWIELCVYLKVDCMICLNPIIQLFSCGILLLLFVYLPCWIYG